MSIKKPTPLQIQAITSNGKTVLKSCPGSGKTFVVAKKMLDETSSWKHKNRGIALLSFTNVANDEVIRQIKYISNINGIGYPHFIGTIDSFITQWIFIPFGHLIMECKNKATLLQATTGSITGYAERIWRRECHQSLCEPSDFYMDIDGTVKNIKKDIDNCPIIKRKPCVVYKNYLFSQGFASHNDVISISLRLLESRPEIGRLLAKRFKKLIIDEAQDTSAYQMKIIDKLAEYGVSEIMIIGDPDQAIYEWRNADPSVFLQKYNDADWIKRFLNENFRCSQKICDATFMFSSLETKSTAVGESTNSTFKPLVLRYNISEKDKVIEAFLKICKDEDIDITPESVAILVRGRTSLFGKDYSRINELWQSIGSRLLSEATYERDFGSLKRATSFVERTLYGVFINSDDTNNDILDYEIEKVVPLDMWRKIVLDFMKGMPSANTQLNAWKTQTEDLINRVAYKYCLNKKANSFIKIKTRDKWCPDFLIQPIKHFYAKSNALEYLNSTIHAVKGRTFEAVLLLLSANGKLTTSMINTKPIDSEEIRTAYVAMTRAKKVLIVAAPDTVKVKSLVRFPLDYWDIIDI